MPWYRYTGRQPCGHPDVGMVQPGDVFYTPHTYDGNPYRVPVEPPEGEAVEPERPITWEAFKATHGTHAAARDAFLEASGLESAAVSWGWAGLEAAYKAHLTAQGGGG